jgi:hypothetical protein
MFMRTRVALVLCSLCLSAFLVLTLQAQQDPPNAPSPNSPNAQADAAAVEGTVVSTTRHTLVVRSDDNQYHLFTFADGSNQGKTLSPGTRVRVNGSAPEADGTEVAENVAVLQPGSGLGSHSDATDGGGTGNHGDSADASGAGSGSSSSTAGADPAQTGRPPQAAPPPPQVRHVTNEIENEARRWHGGGRVGFGFSPQLFMFGLQSQIGPFFSRRFVFRPNVDFGFGELTDMYSLNLEGAYRLRNSFRGGWTPYIGMGPALNFIHQGASSGDVSFSNFSYNTGFNVFVGGQKRKTFVEMKTSLWSGKAPVLRLFVGYNF